MKKKHVKMDKHKPISFQNLGDFLDWWLKEQRLDDKTQRILLSYYSNYRNYFDGYLKKAWADRHLELDKYIRDVNGNKDLTILDLGCGTGSISLYLAYKLLGKAKVLGIDINRERLFCATERLKLLQDVIQSDLNCEFRSTNIFNLSSGEKFDLIYLEETFHHLEPRKDAVKKIADTLNQRGTLIISEVNAFNPFMQAVLFRKRGLNTIIEKSDESGDFILYGNERIILSKKLEEYFTASGLRHISTRYLRLFNVSFSQICGKYLDLMAFEKRVLKMGILKYLFSIHYNMVFTKD